MTKQIVPYPSPASVPKPLPDDKRRHIGRRGAELAFLPAAIEVLDTPASPASQAITILIITLVVTVIVWASFGHLDTVTIASGRIIPGGQVKYVQPLEAGIVRAIHVREGEHVQQGQLLVELDPTEAEVSREQLDQNLLSNEAKIIRLIAFLAFLSGKSSPLVFPATIPPQLHQDQSRMLASDKAVYETKLDILDINRARIKAGIGSINAEIRKLELLIPFSVEREADLKKLLAKNIVRKREWAAVKQQLIELEQGLVVQKHKREGASIQMRSIGKKRRELLEQSRSNALRDLAKSRERKIQATLALRRSESREKNSQLTAPVSGTIAKLNIHTVGGVVRTAELLMTIVPEDSPLEVEVMLLNRDIGFIYVAQPAEIKVTSFPFTRYGLIDGAVTHISADALQNNALGLVYLVRASLSRDWVKVKEKRVSLAPGMTVILEIKTGKRRIIEYFLDPLLKHRQEALRER